MEKEIKNGNSLPKLIVVLGPTAVGKSDMAVEIALALKNRSIKTKAKLNTKHTYISGAEIVSADSRQVYVGLNIGAGKITKKEMRGVPHHCLDIISPKRKKQFSVVEFKEHAELAIADILKRGKVPILCGGTGFYIDAVVNGVVLPDVETNPELRKKLETYSTEKLVQILAKLDPARLEAIDQQNRVRLIRSIEIAKVLGKVPVAVREKRFETLIIGLDMEKDLLMKKVHTRAIKRLKKGMTAEAEKLHAEGVTWKRMKQLGLEYGLLADLLQNKITQKEFIDRLLIETWQYAKRQRTWFKKMNMEDVKNVHWLDMANVGKATRQALKLSLDFCK